MPTVSLEERKKLAKEWQVKYMPKKEKEVVFESSMIDDFNNELNKLREAVTNCDGSALEHASESAAVALAAYYEKDISGDQLLRMGRQVKSLNKEFIQRCMCIHRHPR